jgi:hypothetical protein
MLMKGIDDSTPSTTPPMSAGCIFLSISQVRFLQEEFTIKCELDSSNSPTI